MPGKPKQQLGRSETLLETIDRLRSDRYLYAQAVLRIRDKGANLVPLTPNFAQRYVEDKLEAQREATGRVRVVILKARQEGVSTWVAGRFFHRMHLWQGRKSLVLADALDRAQAIFGIYERYHAELPEDLKPELKSRATKRHLAFAHDSEINIRPASDKDAGRAQTIHQLHCSEIAFWPVNQQRDVWVSAMQAVPDLDSEIIVESTAQGAGGLFHELWELSQVRDSGWVGIFLPWWVHEEYDAGYGNSTPPTQAELDSIASHPDDFELQALGEGIPFDGKMYVLPLSRLAWRRRTIIERFGGDPITLGKDATRDFQQEYPATADEAFLMSGSTFFDEDALRIMARHTREPIRIGRLVETHDNDGKRYVKLEDARRGFIELWEEPQAGDHYTIGCDTAEGRLVAKARVATSDTAAQESGGRDYSSATVWRLASKDRPRAMVAIIHGQMASDVFARQVAFAGEYYGCGGGKNSRTSRDVALVAVESNHSSGQRVLEYLKDILKYRRMYWQREINARTKNVERRVGWRTDEKSRWILLDYLAEMIRKGQVDIPDPNTVRELTTFVFDDAGKPQAAEGAHDDRVISLALAAQMEREHRHAVLAKTPEWQPSNTGSGW